MRNLFLITIVFILIASCKKENEVFRQVTFTGLVKDSTSSIGVANVKVKMYWYNLSNSNETAVDSATTDAQGNYTIRATIDVSRFNNESLETTAIIPNEYVSPLDLEHTEVSQSCRGVESDKLQMITMYLFQKATLDIHLIRTSSDIFSDFHLYYNYGNRGYWVIAGNNNPTGSITYRVITAARVQTKVLWSKKLSTGAIMTFDDSITCLPNITNEITMNY